MLNIKSILTFVHDGIKNKDVRFTVEDDEHIIDHKTGVEYHLYDDDGKITRGNVLVAKLTYFTKEEREVLFAIKKLISSPELLQKKIAHYPVMVAERRQHLSDLYEKPQPAKLPEPEPEANTVPYRDL